MNDYFKNKEDKGQSCREQGSNAKHHCVDRLKACIKKIFPNDQNLIRLIL